MKKIVGFSLLIILISFLLLLSKYLVIEEILGFFLFPILLVIIVSTIPYLIIRIFRKISYKKFITNSLVVACVLQLVIVSLILWSASNRYFAREKVINDIDYSIKIMEDVHPNLYAEISKKAFIAKTDSLKRLLPLKVSDVEAYKTLRKIFSQLRDGHTGGGWNFFSNRMAILFRKSFPYKIEIKNERMFVSKNYFYRNTIPVGSEIIKINGKTSNQCLSEINELLSYETIPFRNAMLSSPLFWGLWNDFQYFEITYKAPDTKTIRTIRSTGGLISKILAFSESSGKNYSYKILPDNIGYIEFNSFNDLDKFKTFLDSTFRSIEHNNVRDLIIDIRKNGGGNSSLGDEIMQYISKTDFKMADSCIIKISNELINKKQLNWIDSAKRVAGSLYNSHDTSKTKLRENSLRFKGKSYLLIGGNTFSSATMFACSFQCYNVGKIIGTETGGLTACFGDVYSFELPNTKLNMGVSYKKFYNACGIDNRRGVIPDYIIENSFEDERKGIDRVLKFTIDLIEQNKK
jgi:Periplasmic protease